MHISFSDNKRALGYISNYRLFQDRHNGASIIYKKTARKNLFFPYIQGHFEVNGTIVKITPSFEKNYLTNYILDYNKKKTEKISLENVKFKKKLNHNNKRKEKRNFDLINHFYLELYLVIDYNLWSFYKSLHKNSQFIFFSIIYFRYFIKLSMLFNEIIKNFKYSITIMVKFKL